MELARTQNPPRVGTSACPYEHPSMSPTPHPRGASQGGCMYRSDRYSRVNHSDFGPTLITICTGVALGLLMACNRGQNKTASDTSKPVAMQPVGGDVVDTTAKIPVVVTLASAQDAYAKRQYHEATEAFD